MLRTVIPQPVPKLILRPYRVLASQSFARLAMRDTVACLLATRAGQKFSGLRDVGGGSEWIDLSTRPQAFPPWSIVVCM